jgi:serine/threonine protein kinase
MQHKKSVIHRDLKAENVFFVSDCQIKVGDFGFSTHSSGNMLDTFCGSPPYAAPELFADNCYQGELVDIWAMGVMLYYMLSGVMPFRGETIPKLKAKILEGKYNKLDCLTPVCQDLISGLLMKEPEERFIMEDIYSSMWLRTGSTAMELNPSKNSLLTKTNSRSKLPILSRGDEVVDSSAILGSASVSALDASFDSDSDSTPDSEVLQNMESLGVPIACNNLLVGEPRNAIAGTYRILVHRKHLLKLTPETQEREHSAMATEPQERRKKLSTCSMGGGQPLASESRHRPGSGGSVHKHKSAKAAKKDRKQQETSSSSKLMSKICVIL